MTLSKNTVLIIIDMQQAFEQPGSPRRNNPDLDKNGLAVLAAWRKAGRPIIHVRHDSVQPGSFFTPGTPGNRLRPGFEPQAGEPLVSKSVNSAFIGTDLDLRLRRLGAEDLVMFGWATDQCVSTTVRMAANMGYRVTVVGDACATHDQQDDQGVLPAEQIHRAHLATIATEFGKVVRTKELLNVLQCPRANVTRGADRTC